MSEHEPNPRPSVSFDEMELHTDQIHRPDKPPIKRGKPKSGNKALLFLLFILFAAASTAAWYFFDAHRKLERAHNMLLQEGEHTKTDLTKTVGTLEEARVQLAKYEAELKKSRALNQRLTAENKKLEETAQKNGDEAKNLKSRLDRGDKELGDAKNRVAQVVKQRDNLKDNLEKLTLETDQKIGDLEKKLADQDADFKTRSEALTQSRDELNRQLAQMKREKERIEKQFTDESEASLRIIQEQSQLRTENANLNTEVKRLRSELTATQKKVTETRDVQVGELVAFSDEIEPAKIRYREPFSDGAKIPKRIGRVAVQALINEVGAIDKAFIIPGQELEGALAQAIVTSIYKWKFTPPSYRGVRVKTWQTILVESE